MFVLDKCLPLLACTELDKWEKVMQEGAIGDEVLVY